MNKLLGNFDSNIETHQTLYKLIDNMIKYIVSADYELISIVAPQLRTPMYNLNPFLNLLIYLNKTIVIPFFDCKGTIQFNQVRNEFELNLLYAGNLRALSVIKHHLIDCHIIPFFQCDHRTIVYNDFLRCNELTGKIIGICFEREYSTYCEQMLEMVDLIITNENLYKSTQKDLSDQH